jgi:hypothetical protein
MTDSVWHRIDRELSTRRARHQEPNSWAAVARALDTTEQRVNNWKRRGVPTAQHVALAGIFGWSVDQMLGLADAEPMPIAPPASELHRRLLVAFDACLATDQARFVSQIEARAAELRELGKRMLRENLIPTPPSTPPAATELRNPTQPADRRRPGKKGSTLS